MKIIITSLLVFASLPVFAQTAIISSPDTIREYEDFYVKFDKNKSFQVDLSAKCLTVQRLHNTTSASGTYSTGDAVGSIHFDNKCFEKQKINMTFRFSDGTQEKLKFIVSPRREEKSDMGC